MFCASCGNRLSGGEAFCGHCGTRVQTIAAGITQPVPESKTWQSPAYEPPAPIPASPYAPGNYIQSQIQRISRNRMILFGILALYNMIPVLPLLVASAMSPSDVIPMALFFGAPALLFLWLFLQARKGYVNYKTSGVYKKLQKLGDGSADEVGAMLSGELESALLFSHKKVLLTEHWIFIQGKFTLHVFSADSLVWAYTYVLNGTFYQVIFALSGGVRRSVHTLRRRVCNEILEGISQSYPHVLLGYAKINRELYKEMCTK